MIQKSNFHRSWQLATSFICILSCLIQPSRIVAQEYSNYPPSYEAGQEYIYQNENENEYANQSNYECCESPSYTGTALTFAGAAIVGAVAGYLAGRQHNDHSHSGSRGFNGSDGSTGAEGPTGPAGPEGPIGPTGPEGSGPFIPDVGQTLTFDFTIELTSIEGGGTATIIPFVSTPDGTVEEGTPLVLTSADIGIISTPSISVENPVFGTYTAGFNVITTLSASIINLSVDTTASRDNSVTQTLVLPLYGALANVETQLPGFFVYGPTNVP